MSFYSKWFEPGVTCNSVLVGVVLRRTVVRSGDWHFNNLSRSYHQSGLYQQQSFSELHSPRWSNYSITECCFIGILIACKKLCFYVLIILYIWLEIQLSSPNFYIQDDLNLPAVPPIEISVPQNYPYSSPECKTANYSKFYILQSVSVYEIHLLQSLSCAFNYGML